MTKRWKTEEVEKGRKRERGLDKHRGREGQRQIERCD